MLSQIEITVLSLFHVLGLCMMLIGVFYLLTAILGARGADGYIKGIACILIGGWVGHLGGSERSPSMPARVHREHFMTGAPVAAPRASLNAQPVGARGRNA
jgi:hypothetical protein